MTREEAIKYNKNLREYMRITDKNSEYKFLKENYEALDMAIKALEQKSVLDKIFCIVHPLSIMSTSELEHKAIMQIAEMLEPLCLPESEVKE